MNDEVRRHQDDACHASQAQQWLIDFLRSDDDCWPYEIGRIKRSLEAILRNAARELIAIGEEWEHGYER